MSEQPVVRSEKLLQAHNTGEQRNQIPAVEAARESVYEQHERNHDTASKHSEQASNLESARRAAQEQAISAAEAGAVHAVERPSDDQSHSFAVHQQLKNNAYRQSLRTIQRRLPRADQAFSKVIHNPRVEAISEFGAKYVARPSGILGGSICALIGSALLVYLTRHFGFPYNYTMFIIFFVGGFVMGLILEPLFRLLRRKHN